MPEQFPSTGESYFEFESLIDSPPPKSKVHHHNVFELYYLVKGVCWYFIDKKSYRLTTGDIALIPVGVIHKTNYETATFSRDLIYCSMDYIPASVRPLIPELPYFSKSEDTAQQVQEIFRTIKAESASQDPFSRDIVRNKVAELMLLIARVSQTGQKQKQESPVVEKTVEYIHNHYKETVTLRDAAKCCYVSREHLSRIFKKETGFGFNEYLNVYRLKKANAMLRGNARSKVSEVALSCGFSDSNYFSKQYKKMYGVAPTKSRKGE